jgi:virginiamycin B lyase
MRIALLVLAIALGATQAAHAADVKIETFALPPGSYPHDVAPAPQSGIVWYSEQRKGALGILDPATGKVETVSLGPDAAPHGVIAGPDGAAWLTDGGQNAILRVDAKTKQVRKFPLPEARGYVNLNTAVFDKAGTLWFTGQDGVYGRLDVETGKLEVWDAPRGPGAYGIAVTTDGGVFFASLASSYVGRIDLASAKATALDLPTPNQGARRVWGDSKGNLWVSEWNAGKVARYDPKAGAWQEWKLPGERPQPYAVYVGDHDMVWLSEWRANAIVRFDPTTTTFTSFPIARSGADVRQINGRTGEVWTPESGTAHLTVYRTK